jgi:hypothetical protein
MAVAEDPGIGVGLARALRSVGGGALVLGDADQVRAADAIESTGQSRSSHPTTASWTAGAIPAADAGLGGSHQAPRGPIAGSAPGAVECQGWVSAGAGY